MLAGEFLKEKCSSLLRQPGKAGKDWSYAYRSISFSLLIFEAFFLPSPDVFFKCKDPTITDLLLPDIRIAPHLVGRRKRAAGSTSAGFA